MLRRDYARSLHNGKRKTFDSALLRKISAEGLFFMGGGCGIEWHSGFQPLMAFNDNAVQRSA